MAHNKTGHVVAGTMLAWGHTKSATSLLCKLVRLKNIYATFIVAIPLYDKVIKEISRQFLPGQEDDLKAMIRVVAINCDPLPKDMEILQQNIVKTCEKLIQGESVEAQPGSGIMLEKIVPPTLLLIDFFLYEAFLSLRKITNGSIPIYCFQSGAVTGLLFLFGPESLGGNGDLMEKMKPIMNLPEKERDIEAEKIYRRIKNELLEIPGLPPMHDYEFYPQKWIFDDASVAFVSAPVYRHFNECDGIVMNSIPLLEGPALEAWQKWYGSRPVISAGPTDFEIVAHKEDRSPDTIKVIEFMDTMLKKYGPNSVIYMSFGSMWWTREPEKVWAVIDIFIEKEIPFIYSHASPFTVVPPEVAEKIAACGFGLESTWMPQTEILKHEACGWFITHCGHNSILESLSAGVPLICWPFEVDQPANAANIAFTHNMGYELFEIRSGFGLLPIHRIGGRVPTATVESVKSEVRDVLTKARGEDGKKKRENVLKFRDSLAASWKDGGESWKELEKLADLSRR